MMEIVLLVLAVVALLPAYVYLLSKFAQVGRMAGARWFDRKCEHKRGR